jgi:hypothetical protein
MENAVRSSHPSLASPAAAVDQIQVEVCEEVSKASCGISNKPICNKRQRCQSLRCRAPTAVRPPREGGGGESESERERERELYCELLHNEFVEPEHDGARARLGTIIFVISTGACFWGSALLGLPSTVRARKCRRMQNRE